MPSTFYYDSVTGACIGSFAEGHIPPTNGVVGPETNDGRDSLNLQTGELIPYAEPIPLNVRLDNIFEAQSLEAQLQFSGPMSLVLKYAQKEDWAKVYEIIETTPAPPEFEPVRQLMLAEFSK